MRWIYMDLHGFTWIYMDLHGFTWIWMYMVQNICCISDGNIQLLSMAVMKKYFFPLEKLYLVLFYFSPFLTFTWWEKWIFLGSAVIILILSYIFQRARMYTPLLIIPLILSYFDFVIAQMIIVVLIAILMAIVTYYKVPNLGRSGYKKWQHGDLEIGIFYPTNATKGETVKWVPDGRYDKVLYEIFFVDPTQKRLPEWIFNFIVSYIKIIDMPVLGNVPYAHKYQSNPDEIHQNSKADVPVLLFSHGLGSNLTNYTSMHGFLASFGYIVISLQHHNDRICVDHREQCGDDHQRIERMLYRERNLYLKKRAQEMKDLYDLVTKQNVIQEALGDLSIKFGKIYLGGHSYGGATVLQTYANLQIANALANHNPIQGIFCLDPWYFPLSQQTYQNLHNPNLLIIQSNSFFGKVPYLYYLQRKFHRLRKANPALIALMLRHTDHLNPSDATFVFGSILQYTGTIQHHKQSLGVLEMYNYMIKEWMEDGNQEQIMEKAGIITKRYGLENHGIWAVEDHRDTDIIDQRRKEL